MYNPTISVYIYIYIYIRRYNSLLTAENDGKRLRRTKREVGDKSTNRQIDKSTNRSFDHSIIRSFDRSTVRPIDRSAVRPYDHAKYRSPELPYVRAFDKGIKEHSDR